MTQRHVFVALGANLPNFDGSAPVQTLNTAIKRLNAKDFRLEHVSDWYRSPAFPPGSGPEFVNGAASFVSSLPAKDILEHLHGVEADLGRSRGQRWAARQIDLDLLAVGDLVRPDAATFARWRDLSPDAQRIETPDRLVLPHPRLQDRGFVLVPLAQIAPDWRHPVTGRSVRAMRDALPPAALDGIFPLTEGDFD